MARGVVPAGVVATLLLLVLLSLYPETADSACCRANFFSGRCGDGTVGTPCCGYRKCNFFCCACQCRGRRKREVSVEVLDENIDDGVLQVPEEGSDGSVDEEEDPFTRYDSDGDGRISLGEARRWLLSGGCGNPIVKVMALSSEFGTMDSDNDGQLDRQEIGG